MKVLRLERWVPSPLGTWGYLRLGEIAWLAMEKPWRGNRRSASCIPAGTYPLRPCIHNIGTPNKADDYPSYEVCDVPDRTVIHIHIGNTILDVEGCVVLGTVLGVSKGLPAVLNSRVAFDQFMSLMNGAPGELEVVNMFPDELLLDWDRVEEADR